MPKLFYKKINLLSIKSMRFISIKATFKLHGCVEILEFVELHAQPNEGKRVRVHRGVIDWKQKGSRGELIPSYKQQPDHLLDTLVTTKLRLSTKQQNSIRGGKHTPDEWRNNHSSSVRGTERFLLYYLRC